MRNVEFESNKALYARQAHLSQHQNDSDTLWQPHLASRWATGVDASSSHGSNHGDPPAFAAGPVPDGTGGERRRDGQQSQVRHRFASPFAQLHDQTANHGKSPSCLKSTSAPNTYRTASIRRKVCGRFLFFFFLKFGFSIPPHRERDERKGANHSRPEIAGRQFCHRRCDDSRNWKPSHPRISGGSCSSGRPSVLAASHAVATGAPAPPKPSSKIGSAGPLGLRNFPRPRLYGRRVDARRPAALPPSYGRKSLRLATPIVARAVATSQELRSFGSRRKRGQFCGRESWGAAAVVVSAAARLTAQCRSQTGFQSHQQRQVRAAHARHSQRRSDPPDEKGAIFAPAPSSTLLRPIPISPVRYANCLAPICATITHPHDIFAWMTLRSIPEETVISPRADPEPIPMAESKPAPTSATENSGLFSFDGATSTGTPGGSTTASFTVDVVVYCHVHPSTFRFSCLPVSRVECLLQLPSLHLAFSSKRSENQSLTGGGLSATGYLSDLSVYIFHPYRGGKKMGAASSSSRRESIEERRSIDGNCLPHIAHPTFPSTVENAPGLVPLPV